MHDQGAVVFVFCLSHKYHGIQYHPRATNVVLLMAELNNLDATLIISPRQKETNKIINKKDVMCNLSQTTTATAK